MACFAVLALLPVAAGAAPRTVCTITVNSPDEKESFRRHLGSENYRFVELVERGRADWLDSSCRAGVACDILVISAHYDGGNEFFEIAGADDPRVIVARRRLTGLLY